MSTNLIPVENLGFLLFFMPRIHKNRVLDASLSAVPKNDHKIDATKDNIRELLIYSPTFASPPPPPPRFKPASAVRQQIFME